MCAPGEAFLLRGLSGEPALLVRRQTRAGPPVLYVHGATFPSALSAAYRFAGRSWMDDLNAHGFDAWAFDFAGFGGSQRYAAMQGGMAGEPVGRAPQASAQIARVVDHIAAASGHDRVSIIAHSWGTMPACLFAARCPERIERLCLFGPVVQRETAQADEPQQTSWRLVTVAEQLARFIEDVPLGHAPVLIEPQLAQWGPAYLASDRDALARTPPAVKVPNGPTADIHAAWSGKLIYRPRDIGVPTLIVRGEWDSVTNDLDAAWLLARIDHRIKRDVKVAKGTHLMHLEHSREDLFAAVNEFLGHAP
mgnify:CR=1 FL=1